MVLSALQTLEWEVIETLGRLGILITLVLAIALFVAAELSLIAANPAQIAQAAQQTTQPNQAKAAQFVQQAQANLQHYLSVTQTGTTAGSLLLGWLGEGATVHWLEPWIRHLPLDRLPSLITTHLLSVVIAFALVTYTEILLGELVPKVLASQAPEQTSLRLIGFLRICSTLFWPFLLLLNSNVRFLTSWVNRSQSSLEAAVPLPLWIQVDAHTATVTSRIDLAVCNRELGLSLPSNPAYRTLGGLMIHQLGHVPEIGERLCWGELELEAIAVTQGNLETIAIRQILHPLTIPPTLPTVLPWSSTAEISVKPVDALL